MVIRHRDGDRCQFDAPYFLPIKNFVDHRQIDQREDFQKFLKTKRDIQTMDSKIMKQKKPQHVSERKPPSIDEEVDIAMHNVKDVWQKMQTQKKVLQNKLNEV